MADTEMLTVASARGPVEGLVGPVEDVGSRRRGDRYRRVEVGEVKEGPWPPDSCKLRISGMAESET